MPNHDYIPKSDAGKRDWLDNFSARIAADPARYGLTEADAEILTADAAAFAEAYQVAQRPETRTAPAVAHKDSTRAAAVATARVFAQLIKANRGVDNADKLNLGLRVNDTTRTPVSAPTTAPVLMIVGATGGGVHVLRYADEKTPSSRRKPAGVATLQLMAFTTPVGAPTPIVSAGFDPSRGGALVGLFTTQPIEVQHEHKDDGGTATYFARWVTRTGKTGPWSAPVSMTIAFGGSAGIAARQVQDTLRRAA